MQHAQLKVVTLLIQPRTSSLYPLRDIPVGIKIPMLPRLFKYGPSSICVCHCSTNDPRVAALTPSIVSSMGRKVDWNPKPKTAAIITSSQRDEMHQISSTKQICVAVRRMCICMYYKEWLLNLSSIRGKMKESFS